MHRWAYVLIFDDAVGTRDQILEFLNTRSEVLNWYTCLPNAVFLVSDTTAGQLQKVMLEFTRGNGRFLILDTKTDKNGWLPKRAWDFLNNPRAVFE